MKALLNEKIVRTRHYQELWASDAIYSSLLIKICTHRQNQENWSGDPELPNKGTHLDLTRGVQSPLFGSHLKDGTRAAWPKLKRAIGDGKEENERAAETSFLLPITLCASFALLSLICIAYWWVSIWTEDILIFFWIDREWEAIR